MKIKVLLSPMQYVTLPRNSRAGVFEVENK